LSSTDLSCPQVEGAPYRVSKPTMALTRAVRLPCSERLRERCSGHLSYVGIGGLPASYRRRSCRSARAHCLGGGCADAAHCRGSGAARFDCRLGSAAAFSRCPPAARQPGERRAMRFGALDRAVVVLHDACRRPLPAGPSGLQAAQPHAAVPRGGRVRVGQHSLWLGAQRQVSGVSGFPGTVGYIPIEPYGQSDTPTL
jgi:hypothetical protein